MAIMYQKPLEITGKYDVAVCGGGSAGFMAALASARSGAKTVLIEKYGILGGAATVNLVGPFMTCFDQAGERQIIKGYYDELMTRMEAQGQAIHPAKVRKGSPYAGFYIFGHDHVGPFEPEALKKTMLDMLREAGVDILFYTTIIDAQVENNRVDGLVVHQKEGLSIIQAAVTVDCTGDAEVAFAAGAACLQGRNADGLTQPMTLFFILSGIKDEMVEHHLKEHPEEVGMLYSAKIKEMEAAGISMPRNKIGMYRMNRPGQWRFNCTRVLRLNPTKSAELSKADHEARDQVDLLVKFLKEKVPGFENAVLEATGSAIGVRESRRIKGIYTLVLDDMTKPTHFPDTIGLCGYPVDIHNPAGKDGGASKEIKLANFYEMPYRILVPETMNGLLVAGRCSSASHEALAAIRVMPPVFALGQAAGTAAALAVKSGCEPRDIDVAELQKTLTAEGAVLA